MNFVFPVRWKRSVAKGMQMENQVLENRQSVSGRKGEDFGDHTIQEPERPQPRRNQLPDRGFSHPTHHPQSNLTGRTFSLEEMRQLFLLRVVMASLRMKAGIG
jgi:hypothetical protein